MPAALLAWQLAGIPGDATLLLVAAVTAAAIQVGGFLLRDSILRVGVYGPPV